MDRHVIIVANTFRVAGVTLGIPSLIAFIWLLWCSVRLFLMNPPPLGANNVAPDSAVGLLVAGGRVFARVATSAGALGQWFILALCLLSFLVLLFSAALFVTGSGVYGQQMWARILASLLGAGLLLFSVMAISSAARTAAMLTGTILGGFAVYLLWALWKRTA